MDFFWACNSFLGHRFGSVQIGPNKTSIIYTLIYRLYFFFFLNMYIILKVFQAIYFSLNFEWHQIIGYNRFYLNFNRSFNTILHQQLASLYNQLAQITLTTHNDIIIWRWSKIRIFSTSSCYNWLDFRGIQVCRFSSTWKSIIPLKIKVFLWLVRQNKILTKDNLIKKSWQGNSLCVFCNCQESTYHLFISLIFITFNCYMSLIMYYQL
jgi:zinc-binding in reverse transcriptase